MPGLDPRFSLPAGRRLTQATEDALMAYWQSVSKRTLTSQEIINIVGAPLPNPIVHTEFATGEYPRPRL